MYRILWNWNRDERIRDQFTLMDEEPTFVDAIRCVLTSIDIQEDGNERPLKYRIEREGKIVAEIDADVIANVHRLSYTADVRKQGKEIFKQMFGGASTKTQ